MDPDLLQKMRDRYQSAVEARELVEREHDIDEYLFGQETWWGCAATWDPSNKQ